MQSQLNQTRTSRPLRVALLSTPRAGNTWLRKLLATTLNLTEWAVHTPRDINWACLPDRVIIQLHWSRDPQLEEKLAEHNFRVVALSRHPLDVLISILAFAQHDSSTRNWLGGAAGNEQSLEGAAPLSPAFLQYALSDRAAALLKVSGDWHSYPGVCRIRYEDLVSNPASELQRLAKEVEPACEPDARLLEAALYQNTAQQMRSRNVNELFHVWQARPNLWKELLPAATAHQIYSARSSAFAASGYTCEPNVDLQPARAAETWDRMEQQTQSRILTGLKRQFGQQDARQSEQIQKLSIQLETDTRQQADARLQFEQRYAAQLDQQAQRATEFAVELGAQIARLRLRLAEFEDVTPKALVVARRLQRFPKLFGFLDFLLSRVQLPVKQTSPAVPTAEVSR